jgi:flagellar basal-body rod modification protein FlgD
MDVTATTSGTSTTAGPASAKTGISADYQTFLKMLTAQMQNQDPLNPVDSSEYAVQLATFSSVEQQVRTNDLLTQLVSGASGSNLADLAGWVGMEARVTGTVGYGGTPVEFSFDEPAGAVKSEIVILDATGKEIARLDVGGAGGNAVWTGMDAEGEEVPQGEYTASLVTYDESGTPSIGDVSSYAIVTEVRGGLGEPQIVLVGGQVIDASVVTALRAAP